MAFKNGKSKKSGATFPKTWELVSLRKKKMIGCDNKCDPLDSKSCDIEYNGGLMTSAYQYALKASGLEKENDYSYIERDDTCKFNKNKIVVHVSNFNGACIDEDQFFANLVKNGPL